MSYPIIFDTSVKVCDCCPTPIVVTCCGSALRVNYPGNLYPLESTDWRGGDGMGGEGVPPRRRFSVGGANLNSLYSYWYRFRFSGGSVSGD